MTSKNFTTNLLPRVIFLLLVFTQPLFAQDCDSSTSPEIRIDQIRGFIGDEVCLNFTASNIDNLVSFAFTLGYEEEALEYIRIDGAHPDIETADILSVDRGDGSINFLWEDSNGQPISAPDGSLFLTLCFRILAIPKSPNPIVLSERGNLIREFVIDINGQGVPAETLCQSQLPPDIQCADFTLFTSGCSPISGQNNGKISFFPCGGALPYTYTLSGFPPDLHDMRDTLELPFDLAAGVYTLTVADGMGVVRTASIDISGTGMTMDLTPMDPRCAIESSVPSGSIQANVSGGSGDYSYNWSTTPFNIDLLGGLTNGTYSVTATDALGCSVVESATLQADTLKAEISDIFGGCPGGNGGFEIIVSGGEPSVTGEYTFQLWPEDRLIPNPSFQGSATQDISNIPTGEVGLWITDDKRCQLGSRNDPLIVTIPQDKSIETVVIPTLLACGATTGNIEVQVNSIGGNPSAQFTYELRDENNTPVNSAVTTANQTHTFPNIPLGMYTILVSTGDGCSAAPLAHTLMNMGDQTLVPVVESPGCTGASNSGRIEFDIIGLSPVPTFTWTDGATGPIRDNLPSDTYEVTIEFNNGCNPQTEQIAIAAQGSFNVDPNDIMVTTPTCPGDVNGSIEINVSNANGTLSYDWNDGDGSVIGKNSKSSLPSGDYNVVISTDAGCPPITQAINIPEVEEVRATDNPIIPACANDLGSVGVAVTGGTGPYDYVWSHPNNDGQSLLVDVETNQTYSVLIRDANGCTPTNNPVSVFLPSAPEMTVTMNVINDVSCFGESTGSATVTASHASTTNDIAGYIWDGNVALGPVVTVDTFSVGEHFVLAFDDASCFSDTIFFEVEEPEPISLATDDILRVEPSCTGEMDGSVTAAAEGGSAGYDFQWPQSGITGGTLTNIGAGTYEVLISDASGCTQLDSITLEEPTEFTATIDPSLTTNLSCSGIENGMIGVSASGGNDGPILYNWTPNVSDRSLATDLGQGIYNILVTDSQGCTATTSHEILAPEDLSIFAQSAVNIPCFGDRVWVKVDSVQGGSGSGYRFSINNSALQDITDSVSVFAGTYDLTVFDQSGCSSSQTVSVEQPGEIIVEIGDDFEMDLGDSRRLVALTNASNPLVTWSPVDQVQCVGDNTVCDAVTISPNDNTSYTVVVTDEFGCAASDEVLVTVNARRNFYVPNVFSPNNNLSNENNLFQLYTGTGVELIEMFEIFDRWGRRVHKVADMLPSASGVGTWDGKFDGRLMDSGVYVYYSRVRFTDGQELDYKGTITLLR